MKSTDKADKSAKSSRNKPSYKVMVIAAIGIITLIYLATFIPEIKSENGQTGIAWLPILRALLVAFGSAAAASLLVDAAFTRWAIDDLRGATSKALSDATKSLSVLNGCKLAGVENVFPTRPSFYEHLAKRLNTLEKGTVVKIIGISLRDFFREGPPGMGPVSDVYEAFWNTISAKNIRFRICLIDPMSPPGIQRSFREEHETVNSISKTGLFDDVKSAVEQYLREEIVPCPNERNAEYTHSNPHFRPAWDMEKCMECDRPICMCLYGTSPHCFVAEFPDSLYIEQYHYGQSGGGRKGGQSPVLQLSKNAHAFQHLQGHIDYVWTTGKRVAKETEVAFNEQYMADINKEKQPGSGG